MTILWTVPTSQFMKQVYVVTRYKEIITDALIQFLSLQSVFASTVNCGTLMEVESAEI